MLHPDGPSLVERRQLWPQGLNFCTRCVQIKPFGEFHRNRANLSGHHNYCKVCTKANYVVRGGFRDWRLRNSYNMTEGQYEEMLAAQGGRCFLCPRTSPGGKGGVSFHVDHDHRCCPGRTSCGKCIRGLLCNRCNIDMGGYERMRSKPGIDEYVDRRAVL